MNKTARLMCVVLATGLVWFACSKKTTAGSQNAVLGPTAPSAIGGAGSAAGPGVSAPADATPTPTPTPTPSTQQPGRVTVQGIASEVGGSCATKLTLTVDRKKVEITPATKFEKGTCAEIANGVRAGAIGKLVDGVIVAERAITAPAPTAPGPGQTAPTPPTMPPGMVAVQGTAGSVTGTCPALSLTIDGKKVSITATTKFERGTCSEIANGVRAGAMGKIVDGTIVAERAIVAAK